MIDVNVENPVSRLIGGADFMIRIETDHSGSEIGQYDFQVGPLIFDLKAGSPDFGLGFRNPPGHKVERLDRKPKSSCAVTGNCWS